MILGDNIISSGGDLSNSFHSNAVDGATIFAIKVKDVSRFGVVEFDFQKYFKFRRKTKVSKK